MDLESILYTQGFGSRRQCRGLIESGRVTVAGASATDPDAAFDTDGLVFTLDGTAAVSRARLSRAQQAGRLRMLARPATPRERVQPAARAARRAACSASAASTRTRPACC
jgi:ribosomal protein S4